MRRAMALVAAVALLAGCGSSDGASSSEAAAPGCPTMTMGTVDEAAGPLLAEPPRVAAGGSVTVRLESGRRISPESLYVTSPAPTCVTSILREGRLVELVDGAFSTAIGQFSRRVSFDVPDGAQPGEYRICSVTQTETWLADVCGTVVVTRR